MALIHDLVSAHLPSKRRHSPRGWTMFNGVCCHHRGHNPDTRFRGNMIISQDGAMGYNCYNCGFKTRFDGIDLSKNFEALLHWIGVSDDQIQAVKLELLKNKLDGVTSQPTNTILSFKKSFQEVDLPTGAVPIESVLEWEHVPEDYLKVIEYLSSRGETVANGYDFYWTPTVKHDMNKRLIVPFYYNDIIVGWTARYAGVPTAGTPRYYNSELQPGYIFANENMNNHNRNYIIVTEGPFDAIAVDGVAVLGSELSKEQLAWFLSCDKEIVVVPDRQRKNQGLIDSALDHGWYVSFPEWEDHIKDCADASARYGKIYTIKSILENKTKSSLQISVKRQMFKG